ncbi:MAG: hypothetical protein AAFY41_17735, partial [Bacteroidota bacterium]
MEATIEKLDLKKEDQNYYSATKIPQLKDLDSYYYLSLAGRCDPKSEGFLRAIDKLYTVAYSIKFICKSEDMDFVMPKMEGFWWIDGGIEAQHKFAETPANEWNWKIVIRMPDFVEGDHYYRAIQKVKAKNSDLLKNDEIKFELINEGLCVQGLHIGSFYQEEPTIAKIMEFIQENGLQVAG